MQWISVKERLPVIPPGKYGITVLVTTFDHIYEEINPGKGQSVETASYQILKGGVKDFQTLYVGGVEGSYFGPTGDPVTHWMYLPEPPPTFER